MSNYKMAKLPVINDIKPIILIAYSENGQSNWYLFTLDSNYKPISNIIIYTNEEDNNGNSISTTYSISKDYKITVEKSIISNEIEKILNKKIYTISNDGHIK